MTLTMKLIKRIFAVLAAILMFIPGMVDNAEHEATGMQFASSEIFMLEQALLRGQGIATDGEHYYFSGTYSLVKTSLDPNEALVTKTLAIPPQLLLKGSNHIGGISYHNGKIYAPIEDGSAYDHPYIVIYDADTLEYETIYELPVSVEIEGETRMLHMDGVPWCAVDAARGYLYTAEWSTAEYLNVFSLSDLSFVKTVKLNMELDRIQGACMYDGMLYLSSDNKEDGKQIFILDPVTGQAELFAARFVGKEAEAESMTVYPMADGTLFHVVDVFSSRIGGTLRHYKPV